MADQKKNQVVLVDEAYLKDFDGADALVVSQDELKAKAQQVATASLPTLIARAVQIVKNSKNDLAVINAMKFIKSISDGEVRGKQVDGMAKKLSDTDLLNTLEGQYEDVE